MRVLIVEDSGTARGLAVALVKSLGFSAETAVDGTSALLLLSLARFDLVLMDLELPDRSGLDVTRALRAEPGASRFSPVVALTATDHEATRIACREAGMLTVLHKPLQRAQLEQVLRRVRPARQLTG